MGTGHIWLRRSLGCGDSGTPVGGSRDTVGGVSLEVLSPVSSPPPPQTGRTWRSRSRWSGCRSRCWRPSRCTRGGGGRGSPTCSRGPPIPDCSHLLLQFPSTATAPSRRGHGQRGSGCRGGTTTTLSPPRRAPTPRSTQVSAGGCWERLLHASFPMGRNHPL